MKKRFVSLALALLLCLAFVACGDGENSNNTNSTKGNTPEINFEEVTLVDNDDVVVKITEVDNDSAFGFVAKFYLENKTDKTLMYSMDGSTINGIKVEPLLAEEVAPGKKSNTDCTWAISSYKDENIIDIVSKIDFSLKIYDSNDWLADPVFLDNFTIYPYGEDQAKDYVYTPADTDIVLVDNENVRVIVRGYEADALFGYSMNLFLENKTDNDVTFSIDECSVNGFMLDPFWAAGVPAKKVYFTSAYWTDSALEENSITEVTEISFKFTAHDDDNYKNYYVDETFTVNPK